MVTPIVINAFVNMAERAFKERDQAVARNKELSAETERLRKELSAETERLRKELRIEVEWLKRALQEPNAEIERLTAIEAAAKEFLRAVDRTADHTEWFNSIGALAKAICWREEPKP